MKQIAEVSVAPADSRARATLTADAEPGHGGPRSRTDTRARIQQIAVELFTEHGYEGTSLREIAERLGVTKAALYYHFKSKEDIIQSLVEDYQAQMNELIDWAGSQPRTPAVRREILARYMHIVAERDQVFRMLHQNQAVLNTMASALKTLKTSPGRLADQLCGPDAPLRQRIRSMMTLGAISVGWMYFTGQVTDRQELSDIVCDLAAEFAQAGPGEPGGPGEARRGLD
jgi:AcrR family transcriptional regulator